MAQDNIDALFGDDETAIVIPKIVPITKHKCPPDCKKTGQHKFQRIWDDFAMNNPQREMAYVEVVRSRGRMNHEMCLIRMYQSTLDGTYQVQMRATTELTKWYLGTVKFDEYEECVEYYNHCIDVFGFTEVKPVEDSLESLFDDDVDGLFGDDDDIDGLFEEDDEDWGLDDDDDWDIK